MIEVNHLTKRYGNHTAVSDLSFSIEDGQIYGLLGPNGAGKSTTMNIMTGCLAATSGEVKINGFDIFEEPNEAKKQIGYLPEQPPLYLDRTPREYLRFVGQARGISGKKLTRQIENVMAVTQITDVADRLMKNLSKGYKQRVGIAQAILGDPQVIILDEPTVGLDPRQIMEIRELIRKLGENHTVILSSHILSEVQAVCQKVMIISKGKLVASDTPENLEKLFAGRLTIAVKAEIQEEEVPEILSSMASVTRWTVQSQGNGCCRMELEIEQGIRSEDVCRELFFAFAEAKKAILEMNTGKISLEDVFMELTNLERTEESDQKNLSGQYDAGEMDSEQDPEDTSELAFDSEQSENDSGQDEKKETEGNSEKEEGEVKE
ncbi:MAG: ABC transporter ATP-binding protein [Clostridiales bacterium]|nr:ABC transporter ATP-binding protein [Clostridiales bacterium]